MDRIKYKREFKIGDFKYLAGFTDGEGYLGVRKKKRKSLKRGYGWWVDMEISNIDLEILQELKEEWGIGRIDIIKSSLDNERAKICYRWKLEPNDIRKLLPILKSHLRIKRKQKLAELLLEALKLVKRSRWRTEKENNRLEQIYLECKQLNKRGIN